MIPLGYLLVGAALLLAGAGAGGLLTWALRGRGAPRSPGGLALALAAARDRAGVVAAVRQALVPLKLELVCLAFRDQNDDGGHPVLRCLAGRSGDEALPLPKTFAPGEFEPLRRALASFEVASADDVVARAARAVGGGDDRRSEGQFWDCYGVDMVVTARCDAPALEPEGECVGVLLLRGARRPPEALQGQLKAITQLYTSALATTLSLERLERARAGLALEAEHRAERLRSTMGVLENAQAQLVEAEKQATLGRLVAGIVHEVNTPLGTIGSSVDTLLRAIERYRPFVAAQVEALEGREGQTGQRALRAIDQQRQLVDVLSASRERIGEVLARLQRFVSLDAAEIKELDLGQALGDALALVQAGIPKGVAIVSEVPEECPSIPCYPAKLNQVFLNLMQNAIDALEGSGELRIAMTFDARRAVIVFEDTGRGIAAAKLDQVLDFGFTTKLGGRVGLRMGLPASNQAINELGGRLTIDSEVGRGTTVTVTLPLDSTPLTARARAQGAVHG